MTQNKNLKDIVKEIQKLAAPPPPPPAGYRSSGLPKPSAVPTPRTAPKDKSTDTVYQYSGDPAIRDMQKDLINLSKAVVSQINIKDLARGETDTEKGEAASRDSFGDFITKHYLRKSDVPGVEFSPSPKATQMEQKQPSEATRLGVVMDTMSRIGGPAKELSADGKWGPRTQAALQNAYAFAYSMLKLADDFKLPIKSYTTGNLATMKTLISNEEGEQLPNQDKIKNAPRLSRHLQAILSMYNEIKNGILQKPEYQAFIEGDKPFMTYKSEKPSLQLTQQQINAINTAFANKLQVKNKPISIANLLSLDALKSWQQQNLPDMPLQNILISLKKEMPQQEMAAAPPRLPLETKVTRPGREG